MTLAIGMLVGMSSALATVLVGLVGLWVHRRYRAAQTSDTESSSEERKANARKTDAETWGMLNGTLLGEVERLNEKLTEMGDKFTEVENQNDKMRKHIVAVHEWDAAGRPGPLPSFAA